MLGRLHQELYLLYLGSEQMVLTSAQNINDQSTDGNIYTIECNSMFNKRTQTVIK